MSLFPFWLHTQSKLKCLEASISNAEVSLSKSTPDSIKEEAEKETYVTSSALGNSIQTTENGREEKEQEQEENENEKKEMEKGQEEKEKEREEETTLLIEDVEMEIEEDDIVTDATNPNSELTLTSLEEGEVLPPPSLLPDDWAPPPPPTEDEPVPPPPEDELVPPPPPEEPSVNYSVAEMIPPYQSYMAVPTYNYSAPAGGYTQPHYYEAYYTTSAQISAPVTGAVAQAVPVTNGVLEPTVYNYSVSARQSAAEISTKPEGILSAYQTGSYVGTANEILVSSARQAVETVHVAGDLSVASSSAAASSISAPSAVASSIAAFSASATYSAASSSAAIPSTAATSSVAPPAVSKDQLKGILFFSL